MRAVDRNNTSQTQDASSCLADVPYRKRYAAVSQLAKAERRAKRVWVSLVVVLLGIQLVIGGFAIHLATADRSVAIVPDYHTAALNWDAEFASRVLVDQMGWTLEVQVSDTADESGMRVLRVEINDRVGNMIDGINIAVSAFHHARGNKSVEFGLQPIGDGKYQALAPLSKPGIWQLSFSFQIKGQPARVIRDVEVQ